MLISTLISFDLIRSYVIMYADLVGLLVNSELVIFARFWLHMLISTLGFAIDSFLCDNVCNLINHQFFCLLTAIDIKSSSTFSS